MRVRRHSIQVQENERAGGNVGSWISRVGEVITEHTYLYMIKKKKEIDIDIGITTQITDYWNRKWGSMMFMPVSWALIISVTSKQSSKLLHALE